MSIDKVNREFLLIKHCTFDKMHNFGQKCHLGIRDAFCQIATSPHFSRHYFFIQFKSILNANSLKVINGCLYKIALFDSKTCFFLEISLNFHQHLNFATIL